MQQGNDLQTFLLEYADKLKGFNSTHKYKGELLTLGSLLEPKAEDIILDYGCGIGTAIDFFRNYNYNVWGYDRFNYVPHKYIQNEFAFKFNKVYFMHSIAHIEDLETKLDKLKWLLEDGAEITVITPNLDWLKAKGASNYKPDTTVVNHFDIETLKYVFEKCNFKLILCGQFGEPLNGYNERIFIKVRYES